MIATLRNQPHTGACAVNLPVLVAEKIADHAADGKDVEGEVADLKLHLEGVADKLGGAMG